MQIGLLEDNPAIQDYLQKALELQGHHVTIYTYGKSLLDALCADHPVPACERYDLVIVDLNLPGELSGWDVIVHIRQTVSHQALPIIVMSGTERHQLDRVQSLFSNIACLQKPFKLHLLLQMLETSSMLLH